MYKLHVIQIYNFIILISHKYFPRWELNTSYQFLNNYLTLFLRIFVRNTGTSLTIINLFCVILCISAYSDLTQFWAAKILETQLKKI